jgi:hypothetical protein
MVARPQGAVPLGLPGVRRFVPLKDKVSLPVGSTLDATNTSIKLSAAGAEKRGSRGKTRRAVQRALLQGGEFTILQQRAARPVTELRLRGASFNACKTGSARTFTDGVHRAGGRHDALRTLSGRGHGRFRTRGRYSATTVRGAIWRVEDRCEGTLTTVERGTAVVYDLVRNRSVTVSGGHSYLARAP